MHEQELDDDPNWQNRAARAKHPKAGPYQIAKYLKDKNKHVRLAAITNPYAQVHHAVIALSDKNLEVKSHARHILAIQAAADQLRRSRQLPFILR